MSRETLILLIWQALKQCGLDYVGTFAAPSLMETAMPLFREHASLAKEESP